MKNEGLKISILVLVILIILTGIYNIVNLSVKETRKKTFQVNKKIGNNKYYYSLREKCKKEPSANCCLASVDVMEQKKVKIALNNVCSKGYTKNALLCVNSYAWCEKQDDANNKQESKFDYYESLREKCQDKKSINCCLASVDAMEKKRVKAVGSGCDNGYKKSMLKCLDSYTWCEKDEKTNISDNALSVSELINSKVPENNYVEIKAKVGECVKLKVSTDYEGVPAGCRIYDKNNKNLIISTDTFFTQKDSEIVVGGNVVYCGGKKRDKYICALKNTKIINKTTKDIKNKKKNPFKNKR